MRTTRLFSSICLAVTAISGLASAQETASDALQDVPLNDVAMRTLAGDWVIIDERSQKAVDLAVAAHCSARIFSKGEKLFDFDFDQDRYAKAKSVLEDAKGTLSLRFNGPNDLYIASVRSVMGGKPAFGGKVAIRRAVDLRMDLNNDLLGMTYGHTTELSPTAEDVKVTPWIRNSMIVQVTKHNETGQNFYFASFPMGLNYEKFGDTLSYVKCPEAT